MTNFPLAPVSVGSAVMTYLWAWHRTPSPHASAWHAVGVFVLSWITQSIGWVLWTVLVYPKHVSPLRHLPGPQDNHWLLGQWPRIRSEPFGHPMRDW
jgi:hypothetical protein